VTQHADTATTAFPKDFAWGAISSAFQWEGAAFEDGKGASIWDMYASKPGTILGDNKLDVSSDGYHRFEEDVALMRQIGLRAHDLSISWPRVLPDGTGTPNEKGLDFYDRFIDALLDSGIEPWVAPVPLGHAPRSLPSRVMAQPRHRRLVCRLHEPRRGAVLRSGVPLDHVHGASGHHRDGPRGWRIGRGGSRG
jgi:hypothetical protein